MPGVRWQREKWPPWAWFRIGVRGTHVTDTGPLEERAHVMQAGPFPEDQSRDAGWATPRSSRHCQHCQHLSGFGAGDPSGPK